MREETRWGVLMIEPSEKGLERQQPLVVHCVCLRVNRHSTELWLDGAF